MSEIFSYSLSDILRTIYALIVTKIFYSKARLIRRPFHIRGKKHLQYDKGFTTGYNCRIEIFGETAILKLGKNCHLGDNVHLVASRSVVIGDNLLCASKVFISDTSHGDYSSDQKTTSSPKADPNTRPLFSKSIEIGNNVWIGENVVVLAGAKIGDGCIIGSNAVVTKEIPDNCIAAGIPAKPIKKYDGIKEVWFSIP